LEIKPSSIYGGPSGTIEAIKIANVATLSIQSDTMALQQSRAGLASREILKTAILVYRKKALAIRHDIPMVALQSCNALTQIGDYEKWNPCLQTKRFSIRPNLSDASYNFRRCPLKDYWASLDCSHGKNLKRGNLNRIQDMSKHG